MNGDAASTGGRTDIPYATEVKRKLVHLSSLWIPLAIWHLPVRTAALVLGMVLIGSLGIDLLRHHLPKNIWGWRHLNSLFRPKEQGKLSGSSFLLLAALILALFFNREMATLSLTYVVVGDIAGALVGRRFGRHPLFDKTWEGSGAFFLACLAFSPFVPGLPFWAKLLSAAVAAVIEALPLKLDDNFTVPIGTAGFLVIFNLWTALKIV